MIHGSCMFMYSYTIYICNYIYIYISFSSVCLTGGLAANPGIYCCDKWYMSREYCCSCTSLWSLESLCGVCLLVGLWFCFWQHWKGMCPFFSLTVTIFSLLWPFLHLGLSFFWMTCFQLAVECALDERFSFASCCITGWGKQAPSWTLHPVRGWAVLHRCQPMELAPASDQIIYAARWRKIFFWHLYN